jgi:hypothetical protein
MQNKYLLFAIGFILFPTLVGAQANIDIESGAIFTGYNNVRIPGNTGTLFSLRNGLDAKPNAFIRIRSGYTIKRRHTVSLLYAPLFLKSNGIIKKQIDFQGVTFPSNSDLYATYKFNSYRITYRYDIVKRSKIEFGLGFTAKIRDAEIALNTSNLSASKKNVGYVPIINFRLNWKLNHKIGVLFEGDALIASQGRAEDVSLSGTYNITDQYLIRLGYRMLEGGADNSGVYNFALIHYASAGLSYSFKKKLKSKE